MLLKKGLPNCFQDNHGIVSGLVCLHRERTERGKVVYNRAHATEPPGPERPAVRIRRDVEKKRKAWWIRGGLGGNEGGLFKTNLWILSSPVHH